MNVKFKNNTIINAFIDFSVVTLFVFLVCDLCYQYLAYFNIPELGVELLRPFTFIEINTEKSILGIFIQSFINYLFFFHYFIVAQIWVSMKFNKLWNLQQDLLNIIFVILKTTFLVYIFFTGVHYLLFFLKHMKIININDPTYFKLLFQNTRPFKDLMIILWVMIIPFYYLIKFWVAKRLHK